MRSRPSALSALGSREEIAQRWTRRVSYRIARTRPVSDRDSDGVVRNGRSLRLQSPVPASSAQTTRCPKIFPSTSHCVPSATTDCSCHPCSERTDFPNGEICQYLARIDIQSFSSLLELHVIASGSRRAKRRREWRSTYGRQRSRRKWRRRC